MSEQRRCYNVNSVNLTVLNKQLLIDLISLFGRRQLGQLLASG